MSPIANAIVATKAMAIDAPGRTELANLVVYAAELVVAYERERARADDQAAHAAEIFRAVMGDLVFVPDGHTTVSLVTCHLANLRASAARHPSVAGGELIAFPTFPEVRDEES